MSEQPARAARGDWRMDLEAVCGRIRSERLPHTEARRRFEEILTEASLAGDLKEAHAVIKDFEREQYAEDLRAERERNARGLPASWQRLKTLDEVLAEMPPPGERLDTGIPTLDRCSRGGFACGRVYTFVGRPGSGKTCLVCQLARRFAEKHHAAVLCLFFDEGSWQAALMITEGLGFNRAALEDSYSEIRPEVYERTRPLAIGFVDPDQADAVLERAEELLTGIDSDTPIVVAVDSIQTVRTRKGADAQTAKERADAVMAVARILARRLNAIVLCCSKANRESAKPGIRTDPQAAGLDSSSIEYESDVLMLLKEEGNGVTLLTVSKNRPGDGSKPTITLRLDRNRATFAEVDAVIAEEQAAEAEREQTEAKWSADEQRVREALRRYPGRSLNSLRELVHMRKERLAAVLEELERRGEAHADRKGAARLWSGSREMEAS